MKIEWRTIIGASLFLGVTCAIYWFTSYEDAGTVMLLFGFSAYGLLGSFLILQWLRRHRLPRPEDRDDAEQADGAGAVAFFPSASMWPAGIGIGAIFTSLAFIFGNWYWLIGLPVLFGAIIGFVVESEHSLDLVEDVPEELKQHSDLTAPTE
ncbi:MAG: aa3-type cytochrome oxidase subunit IV [Acidimicrobiales bacterium]